MFGKRLFVRNILLFFILSHFVSEVACQTGFDNPTRALYIFDMARYIDYGPGFADSAVFKVGVLDRSSELYWEMGNLAATRRVIQDKPVQLVVFRNEERILHTQILFINRNSGFDLSLVRKMIEGHQTMLITEGYDFRESMINFVVVNGKPEFEANEELIRKAGMSVNQNFMAAAIKTREDWERLFLLTEADLQVQKETVRKQEQLIDDQKTEIIRQKTLLDSLDKEILEKERILAEKERVLEDQFFKIRSQNDEITSREQIIIAGQHEVRAQRDTLGRQKADIDRQQAMIREHLEKISEQEEKIEIQVEAIEKQKIILGFAIIALLLVSFLGYYIYKGYKIKYEANSRLEEKNKTISGQKEEIEHQRDIAAAQRDQIAYQKKHITDSIIYAGRIQAALIPPLELFSDRLEHFVLFKPLDIVSGDFYWVSSNGNRQVIISADCTGHGVPGAFMSMLGVTLLNEIVTHRKILMPDEILNSLRQEVIRSLNQDLAEDTIRDGMDIAVCLVDFDDDILWYSGANCPLYLVRRGELIHYRAERMPVAIHYRMQPFTLHRIELRKGDTFYIFSDGFADQYGGPGHRKYMSVQLKQALVEMEGLPMLTQGERLNSIFEAWRGDNPQVDDVTIIGVRY